MSNYTIIDANNLILGRMASIIAKRLLLGEKIIIVNAEKAVISGKYKHIINSYKKRLEIHTLTNPLRGPFHPRKPDRIVRKTIRGMLPWKKPRGRKAYHNLRVFTGVPNQYVESSNQFETLEDASISRLKEKFIRISDISHEIGGFQY
ncbi:MAG: 50S ribosomal protein L13 [Candidatus Helarchaeota archaeon]